MPILLAIVHCAFDPVACHGFAHSHDVLNRLSAGIFTVLHTPIASKKEVRNIAKEGGEASQSGGFTSMDPEKQVSLRLYINSSSMRC